MYLRGRATFAMLRKKKNFSPQSVSLKFAKRGYALAITWVSVS